MFLIDSALAITVCTLAIETACIRLMFAMARDGRLPFGDAIARVSGRRKVPIVPALVTGFLTLAILALNLANQSAFLALTAVAIIMFYLCLPRHHLPDVAAPAARRPGRGPSTAITSRSGAGGCRERWPR